MMCLEMTREGRLPKSSCQTAGGAIAEAPDSGANRARFRALDGVLPNLYGLRSEWLPIRLVTN
jgi:hypothetical protein